MKKTSLSNLKLNKRKVSLLNQDQVKGGITITTTIITFTFYGGDNEPVKGKPHTGNYC